MNDLQAFADRFEIEALRGEFVDALSTRDCDRVASLFTDDGAWRLPDAVLIGREQIRVGIEGMHGHCDSLAQSAHLGMIELDGDRAVGRAYLSDGDGYAVYHDRYRRTPDGWKFTERVLRRTRARRSDTIVPACLARARSHSPQLSLSS